ncbi:MAG TPA: cytochrome c biogenesis protein CcdA [Chthonomonadaceae bacterium]|nr:cytochrome c biogenesis protein CcdA [Chthonomonadaceae bacterium]
MKRTGWSLTAAVLLAALSLMGLGAGTAQAQFGAPKFIKASATAPKTVAPGKPFTVVVTVTVDKPYHIQANPPKQNYIATVVDIGPVSGFKIGKVVYPKPMQIQFLGERLPVYEGTVQIKAAVMPNKGLKPGKVTLPVTVRYQGCNDKTCYPPSKITTQATVVVGASRSASAQKKRADASAGTLILAQDRQPAGASGTGTDAQSVSVPGFRGSKITQFMEPKPFIAWLQKGGSQAGKADVVTNLLRQGGVKNFGAALTIIYLLGLALNLTPCVYPLIPITIGYFGRQAASGAKTGGLSVSYALGMALMYSALGIFAALAGKVFGSWLNNPWVLVGFAVLMFALGLSMFDRPDGRPIWELQLPSSLTSQARSRAGYAGALLMGLMVGIVAAPCIGPIVVALIQVVSTTRNVALGLATFFTLGIGLATPYLLLGFGLIRALPRAGEWMVAVKHIFGLLLFGMGLYYLRDLLGPTAYRILFTLFAIGSGLYLIFLDKAGRSAVRFQIFKRVVGAVAILLGLWTFLPRQEAANAAPGGERRVIAFETLTTDFDALQARLQQARTQNKEVLIDFWATWCRACKELDEKTFQDPEVAKATGNFVALRLQLEDFDSEKVKPFLKTFGIVGLPTVVHLVPTDRAAGHDDSADQIALR